MTKECSEFLALVANTDWAPSIEAMSGIGNFFTGIGTIGLTLAGYKAFSDYKKQKRFEHKFKLAKRAIYIFNHLRNDIQQIRSPFSFEGELNRLKELPETNEMIKKSKKNTAAGIALLRMDDRSESLAEMNRFEPEFRAFFGDSQAFENIRKAHNQVLVAAMMMLQGKRGDDHIIWSYGDEKDEIKKQIDQAIEDIEKLCMPVLAEQSK